MITKGLIIKKKWLDLILSGDKNLEMRSSKTKIRGRIGLIESGTGLIVGEVDLIDSWEALNEDMAVGLYSLHLVDDLELIKKWKYPWVMKSPIRYDTPRTYNHPKGAVIWVNLDELK